MNNRGERDHLQSRKRSVTAKLAGLRGDMEDLLAAEELAGSNAVLSSSHQAALRATLKHISVVEISFDRQVSLERAA